MLLKMRPIQRSIVRIGLENSATEVLRVPAIDGRPALHVVVIPGNPGQSRFYEPFMRSLDSELGGQADITGITYLGFDGSGLTPPSRVYSLHEQLHHKTEIVAHLQDQYTENVPLVIIGHSIGGWMACRVASELTTHYSVAHVIALMPFFSVNPTCSKQARLRRLTSLYSQLGWAATALAAMPLPIRRAVVEAVSPGMGSHAVEAATQLIHPTTVRNGFFLGRCEFQELSKPFDWAQGIGALGDRVSVFCAPDDIWMPEHAYKEMLKEVPNLRAFWEEDQCHAFCSSETRSDALARSVVRQGLHTLTRPK